MPSQRPVAVCVVCAGMVFQLYVTVPCPLFDANALPSHNPKQVGLFEEKVTANCAGSVIVTGCVMLQPILSVIVTV